MLEHVTSQLNRTRLAAPELDGDGISLGDVDCGVGDAPYVAVHSGPAIPAGVPGVLGIRRDIVVEGSDNGLKYVCMIDAIADAIASSIILDWEPGPIYGDGFTAGSVIAE